MAAWSWSRSSTPRRGRRRADQYVGARHDRAELVPRVRHRLDVCAISCARSSVLLTTAMSSAPPTRGPEPRDAPSSRADYRHRLAGEAAAEKLVARAPPRREMETGFRRCRSRCARACRPAALFGTPPRAPAERAPRRSRPERAPNLPRISDSPTSSSRRPRPRGTSAERGIVVIAVDVIGEVLGRDVTELREKLRMSCAPPWNFDRRVDLDAVARRQHHAPRTCSKVAR